MMKELTKNEASTKYSYHGNSIHYLHVKKTAYGKTICDQLKRIEDLERALDDVLNVFNSGDDIVTVERLETWRAVREGT